MSDPALRFFLDDAKAQGLSVREYEKAYGLVLLPAEHDIAAHEVSLSQAMESQTGRPNFRPINDGTVVRPRARAYNPDAKKQPVRGSVIPFPARRASRAA